MNEKEKLEFVAGQVHMLVGFLLAVIDVHPAVDELAGLFETFEQVTLANTEATLISECYLDGQLDISRRLKRRLKTASEKAQAQQEAHKARDPDSSFPPEAPPTDQ